MIWLKAIFDTDKGGISGFDENDEPL